MASDVFNDLLPELRPLAFTVAGVTYADSLQRIRDLVATLPTRLSWVIIPSRQAQAANRSAAVRNSRRGAFLGFPYHPIRKPPALRG